MCWYMCTRLTTTYVAVWVALERALAVLAVGWFQGSRRLGAAKGHVRSSAGRSLPGNSLPYVHTALRLPTPRSILLSTRVVQSLHGAKMGAIPRYWKGLGCRVFLGMMCAWSGYWPGALAAEVPVHPVVTGLQGCEVQVRIYEEEKKG